MRRLLLVPVAALAVGCAAPSEPAPTLSEPPTTATPPSTGPVDPERIARVGPELPQGYEVGEVGEVGGTAGTAGIGDPAVSSAPVALWGFRPGWTSDPAPCGVLADPAPQPRSVRGLSASGSGGIVYVVATAGAHAGVDPGLLGGCGRWRLTSGHSTATVELVGAPDIAGAVTVGLSASITTAVESGTQTEARAHTFVAYLPDSTAAVTLINDPGSPKPPLSPRYAADLLVATVSELRG